MTKKSVFNFFLSSTYLSYLFSCRILFTAKAIADLDSLIPELQANLEASRSPSINNTRTATGWPFELRRQRQELVYLGALQRG